jgi:hypothetical protein
MTLDGLRISVGRTWRMREGSGAPTTVLSLAALSDAIGALKGGNVNADTFGCTLPWPRYKSTLFCRLLGTPDYKNAAKEVLVRCLVPLHAAQRLPDDTSQSAKAPEIEVFLHPFAFTVIAHFDLLRLNEPLDAPAAAARLTAFLDAPLGTGRRRFVGGKERLPAALPTCDWIGDPLTAEETDTQFVVASALNDTPEASPLTLAYRLAGGANDEEATDHTWKLKSQDAALGRAGEHLGIIFPKNHGPDLLECLHRNTTVLLAYMQNLITLTSVANVDPASPVARFRPLAVDVLNALVTRTAITGAGVYKSRAAEVWASHRSLTTPVT